MKRDKRTHALRVSFTEREWRVIEAQFEAVWPTSHESISPSERRCYFRQALLAVALAAVRQREFTLRLAVDIRGMTAQEREMEKAIENGGELGWIGGPGGARFDFPG